jgi:hypothetical protein
MQIPQQITHHLIGMLPRFKHHGIHRIFAQSEDSSGGTNPIAFGDAADDLSDCCTIVVTVKEDRVARFRKARSANLAFKHLLRLTLLNIGTRLYQVALRTKTVTFTLFVRTKILIYIYHNIFLFYRKATKIKPINK